MTHTEAADIIRRAWQEVHGRAPTENEVRFTQAVAWLETHYGRAGQFGPLAARGLFNWANIEKRQTGDTCPEGWEPGMDNGNAVCFRVYPSDYEAAKALIHTLTKRHWPTLAAMAEGTPEAMAHAMKAPPAYYEAAESLYASAIRNSLKAMGANLPIPTSTPPRAAASFMPLLLLAGLGAGAYMLTRNSGKRIRFA